jgi:hypothetical protein
VTVLYFPVHQKDELFYSWVARYGKHTRVSGHKALQQELFSDRNSSAVMDFPINLDVFVETLSLVRPDMKVHELIETTTLWPYFRPFLPPDRSKTLIASMRGGHGNDIHTRLGLAASRVHETNDVKVCPMCFKHQVETLGEPYIQRLFQLPSVWVCPEHECCLVYSALPFRPKNKNAFTPLSEVMSRPFRSTGFENSDFRKLLTLALDSQELLQGSLPVHELLFWQPMYLNLLPDSCLKGKVSVDQQALRSEVETFWGKEFLQKLGVGLEVEQDNWLQKMVRKHRSAFHPLLHLLFFRAFQNQSTLSMLSQVVVKKPPSSDKKLMLNPSPLDEAKLKSSRLEWQCLLDKNPQASVTQLRRKAPALYTRLYRADQIWLKAHSPKMVRTGNNSENRVDWKVRDFSLARKSLKLIKKLLLMNLGRRVSSTFVLKELKMAPVYEKNKSCFLLTEKVLKKYCESVDDYQMRRIDSVVVRLKKNGVILKEWKIIREARLRDNVSTKVKKHLQACLEGNTEVFI